MTVIREDEWLAELTQLAKRDDEGMTVEEWARKLGKSIERIRSLMERAKEGGWLMKGLRTKETFDGRILQIKVYRFLKPKK